MGRSTMESALRAGSGAPDLKLIETCGWDGAGFGSRLPLHLARLARSAAMLGWDCDLQAVKAALFAAVGPEQVLRVRLTMDSHSTLVVTATPMPQVPVPIAAMPMIVSKPWRVGLAAQKLWSGDPWLSVKTTQRAAYDHARAHLPAGMDEMIFQNERGELCDGTITTVFFDRGAGLRTPPLACGLLPGVLRAQMAVPEEVLLATQAGQVQLWVGNSLRGLIPAVWVDI
jgi:4-amino-4-deoxychorismate lyase